MLSVTAIARSAGISASNVISARGGVAVLSDMDLGSEADSATRLMLNIRVVLAEPTFDPGAVFRLTGEWNDELFRAGERTAVSGLLRVNAIGGGT